MSDKPTDKVYKLPYNTGVDKDIDEFINSIPRNRRAEVIRFGLRYYMKNIRNGNFFQVNEYGVTNEPIQKEEVKQVEEEKPKPRPSSKLFGMKDTQ